MKREYTLTDKILPVIEKYKIQLKDFDITNCQGKISISRKIVKVRKFLWMKKKHCEYLRVAEINFTNIDSYCAIEANKREMLFHTGVKIDYYTEILKEFVLALENACNIRLKVRLNDFRAPPPMDY